MTMYDKLPRQVFIGNKAIRVNTDYRTFINLEIEMQGNEKRAIYNALASFYPAFLIEKLGTDKTILKEMVDKFIWFYLCGKNEEDIKEEKKRQKNGKPANKAYSYEEDSDLIYAAFMQAYHIDISNQKIHWWKFRALFKGLPSSTEFCKIKGYRLYDGNDEQLKELKEFYKLPPTKEEKEEQLRLDRLYEKYK